MEKFTNEFFNNLLSNATSINEAIQIMRNIQDEIEETEGKEKAEQFGEKFNSFILKNLNTTTVRVTQSPSVFIDQTNATSNSTTDSVTASAAAPVNNSTAFDKESSFVEQNKTSSILLEQHSHLLAHKYGDMDVAELFGILYKDKMHYVPQKKIYYIFNGKRWVPDIEHIQVKTYAKDFVKLVLEYILNKSNPDTKPNTNTGPTINTDTIINTGTTANREITTNATANTNMTEEILYYNSYLGWKKRAALIEDCKTVSPLSVEDFDYDASLFNCLNGTLKLDTNEFYEHHASDLLSQIANVHYDADATCERWEEFIDEIMDHDSACIEFLQMLCGLFLTSYTDEECFLLFYGIGGRNGKSTLCDTLLHLMGDYAKTADASSITKKTNSQLTAPNEDLARLRNCRLLSVTSSDEKLNIDTKLIKSLTRHDMITARFPYQDSFEYRPNFKIIISTNYLPRINDSRIFSSNEMILLPFPVHFAPDCEDPTLKTFFCQPENLSGILNWCLEGLEKYMTLRSTSNQGLKHYLPNKVKEQIEECKQEQNFSLVVTFLKENLSKDDEQNISAKDIFRAYSNWCREKDYPRCNYRSFIKELRKQVSLTRRSEGFILSGYTCSI